MRGRWEPEAGCCIGTEGNRWDEEMLSFYTLSISSLNTTETSLFVLNTGVIIFKAENKPKVTLLIVVWKSTVLHLLGGNWMVSFFCKSSAYSVPALVHWFGQFLCDSWQNLFCLLHLPATVFSSGSIIFFLKQSKVIKRNSHMEWVWSTWSDLQMPSETRCSRTI